MTLICTISNCKNDRTKDETITIQGEIDNLPDGNMHLVDLEKKTLAITPSKNGKFVFKLVSNKDKEPILAGLEHIDNSNIKRIFGYQTKLLLNGKPHFLSAFMLEDGIKINSNLKEFGSYPGNVKIVYPENEIVVGKQTEAYFTSFFFGSPSYTQLEKAINSFPYSYYLLYELNKSKSSLTEKQFFTLYNLFDKDVQSSETGKEIKKRVEVKDEYILSKNTEFEGTNGLQKSPLQNHKELQVIVLWASWCGPCRREIPDLKRIYSKYKNNTDFKMISISLDDDKELWKKALEKEKMDWEQLLITTEQKKYQQELFQFDGSIPTTLFINKEGKIINKVTGFDEKQGIKKTEAIIDEYLKAKKKNL